MPDRERFLGRLLGCASAAGFCTLHRNHERVTKTLNLLTQGVLPFVERELKAVYKDHWIEAARSSFREGTQPDGEIIRWDAHSLLTVMWDQWNSVFRHKLGHAERSLVSELRDFRNRWAHQVDIDGDDAYRILDSAQRLLTAIGADEAEIVAREKRDLLRQQFHDELNAAIRKAELSKNKWLVIAVSVISCIAILMQMFQSLGENAIMLAFIVVVLFLFIIYRQMVTRPPLYGPHECNRCSRIIYSETCPYCEIAPVHYVSQGDRVEVAEKAEEDSATVELIEKKA